MASLSNIDLKKVFMPIILNIPLSKLNDSPLSPMMRNINNQKMERKGLFLCRLLLGQPVLGSPFKSLFCPALSSGHISLSLPTCLIPPSLC